MSEIAPALSVEEWVHAAKTHQIVLGETGVMVHNGILSVTSDDTVSLILPEHCPALIALANDALPAESPHKITRADVLVLRDVLNDVSSQWTDNDEIERLANKLESLLRPT